MPPSEEAGRRRSLPGFPARHCWASQNLRRWSEEDDRASVGPNLGEPCGLGPPVNEQNPVSMLTHAGEHAFADYSDIEWWIAENTTLPFLLETVVSFREIDYWRYPTGEGCRRMDPNQIRQAGRESSGA